MSVFDIKSILLPRSKSKCAKANNEKRGEEFFSRKTFLFYLLPFCQLQKMNRAWSTICVQGHATLKPSRERENSKYERKSERERERKGGFWIFSTLLQLFCDTAMPP
jgi:hypothetical protein